MTEVKNRNYIFDILRIFSMLMIITHHIVINDFGLQNALIGQESPLSNKQVIVLILINSFVIIGVNIFFLLSGYFRIKFSLKKIINLIIQVYLVYGIVTLIGILTKNVSFNKEELINILNPFTRYWFLSAYIGICIFSPLLNKILDNITIKESKIFIICSIIFFSIYSFKYDVFNMNGGYSLIWGIILYLTAGIIKKYDIKYNKGLKVYVLGALFNALVIIYIYLNKNRINYNPWQLYKYNNVIVFMESLGLFIWINSLKIIINNKKIINFITLLATSTLMTYLLHSTCWLTMIRRIPSVLVLNNGKFIIGIIILPIYALLIFVICSIASYIYKKTVQRIINYLYKKMGVKYEK